MRHTSKIKKQKAGVLLILLGVGIPSFLYFFQGDGMLFSFERFKSMSRNLNSKEIMQISQLRQTMIISDWLKEYYPSTQYNELKKLMFLEFLNQQHRPKLSDKEAEIEVANRIKRLQGILKEVIDSTPKYENWQIAFRQRLNVPFKPFIGLGLIVILVGLGMIILSLFPAEVKNNIT